VAIPMITTPATPSSNWSDDEIAALRRYYGKIPAAKLAQKLPGRTENAVRRKGKQLGLQARRVQAKDYLSPKGLRQLREMAAKAKSAQEIADMIGITLHTLTNWRNQYPVIERALTLQPEPRPRRKKKNTKCARCAWGTSLGRGRTQVLCSRWPCVKEGEA